jgi:hypothetical protein
MEALITCRQWVSLKFGPVDGVEFVLRPWYDCRHERQRPYRIRRVGALQNLRGHVQAQAGNSSLLCKLLKCGLRGGARQFCIYKLHLCNLQHPKRLQDAPAGHAGQCLSIPNVQQISD